MFTNNKQGTTSSLFAITLAQSSACLVLLLPGLLTIINDLSTSFEEKVASDIPEGLIMHPWVMLPIIQYLLITSVSVVILISSQAYVASKVLKTAKHVRQIFFAQLLWGLILWFSVLTLNTIFFPHSRFANTDLNTIIDTAFTDTPPLIITLLTMIIVIPVGLWTANKLSKLPRVVRKIALLFLCCFSAFYIAKNLLPEDTAATPQKPNIFIIGIDSLRPELIPEYMPFLNKQLATAKIFPNSYTPFARTYPAWVSILTGRFPHNHGARFNLESESRLTNDNQYLPEILKQHGYNTIYAADERRFSNLGKAHGFEKVVGPRTGARDFILGSIADFPTSNLMLKLPFSRYLFPELYGNRAVHKLYYPEHFSSLLTSEVYKWDERPVFLATHFCLPHWPYLYANHVSKDNYPPKLHYPQNLRATDKQIQRLFHDLELAGRLSNSIIIFLSDHGESWGMVSTGLKDDNQVELDITDFGHGMNILSEDSHKVLLAIKHQSIKPSADTTLKSLVDIAPTLFDLIPSVRPPANSDGVSLLNHNHADRVIYFESGIVLAEANTKNPDNKAVAKAGLRYFDITEDGYLRVDSSSSKQMLSRKQLGVRNLRQGLFFLVHPDTSTSKPSILFVNYNAGHFSAVPYDKFESQDDDRSKLLLKFCDAFGKTNRDTLSLCSKTQSVATSDN